MTDKEIISRTSQFKPSEKLLKGMTPEERKEFTGSYMRAKKVLKRLNDYIASEEKKAMLALDNPANFEQPNWQYLIAWQGGYRTAMRKLEDLTRIK